MAKWSPGELDALPRTTSYEQFIRETGSVRSYDSWEVKRRRIPGDGELVKLRPAPVIRGVEGDYIGFNIGFFDIETTFSTQPIMLYGAIADSFGNVRQFRKGDDITDDKDLVDRYSRALEEYDILVSWNGRLFDSPVIGGRLAFHGLRRLDLNLHVDLMYFASGQFMRIGRRSLQSVSEYFDTGNKKTPLSVRIWDKAMSGSDEDYDTIAEHCDADVLVLRDVFATLKQHVRNIHR